MNTDIKQAMHVEAGKSFGTSEANENERHWNDDKIDRKNQDPTNHYDKTRMKLNFEIGPDGKVHPLGYQEKSLEVRLQERLTELGWKPFKPDSKIQPNCCAKFIFGGNHDRTLEMAFGPQTVNLDKGADNSHLQRCPEIEQWAKDVYDWCAKRYGQKNIIGFQVHLDESSPHIHALIVPVGQRAKSGRGHVARLALLFQVMKWATDSGDMQYIERDSVESAIRMIDYYEETYRRIQETIVINSIGETKEAWLSLLEDRFTSGDAVIAGRKVDMSRRTVYYALDQLCRLKHPLIELSLIHI